MVKSHKMLPILLFALLLASTEVGMMKTVEAKACWLKSATFKQNCITAHNWRDCARACRKEGNHGGICRVDKSLAHPIPLCTCTKIC